MQKHNKITMTLPEQITGVWQKWRFSAPQIVLWLIKVWFSASTFVMKIATFAKHQTVVPHCRSRSHIQAHLVFADTQSPNEKPKELEFCQRSTE